MKAAYKLLLALAMTTTLTGCWGAIDLQGMAYVTAIGIDYRDDRFIVHVQILNLSNVAQTEQAQIGKNVPVWIGRGEGKTLVDALSEVSVATEMSLFFGHLKAIVCSEQLLEQPKLLEQLYDSFNRLRDVRYNIWVFGTKENMVELLSRKSILNLSPNSSSLLQYDETYQQGSYVEPLYGFKMIAQMNEPGRTVLLPSLSITSKVWKEDKRPKSTYIVDGIYVFSNGPKPEYKGKFQVKHILGSRWLQKKLNITWIAIPDDGPLKAVVNLRRPNYRISLRQIKDGYAVYDIKVRIKGSISELIQNMTVEEMEKQSAEVLERQIRETYAYALERGVDIYSMSGILYRKHPDIWRKWQARGAEMINEQSLGTVDVLVDLIHTGKYKGKVKMKQPGEDDH